MGTVRKSDLVLNPGSVWLELPVFAVLAAGLVAWRVGTGSHLPFLVWSIACGLMVFRLCKFDYLNPLPAFVIPWLTVSVFGQLDLSRFARPLSSKTYAVIWALEFTALLAYYLAVQSQPKVVPQRDNARFNSGRFSVLLGLYVVLTILNVALAGYVPLISGILTGDTGYMDFGVHGIYGFYNAFANALGVLAFYLYLRTRRSLYLFTYLCIGVVFVLFVSRQNVVSLVIQSVVIYSFVQGRIGRTKLILFLASILILFSIAGNLRSGDVKQIAGIRDEYQNVPGAVVWIYAYSYFNILNLDNIVTNPEVPVHDGSSLFSLLPTFLRPETSHIESEIEVEQFNAYSYVAPIYADIGLWGTVLFTIAVTWWGVRSYQQVFLDGSFYAIAKYSVLFFCALFSFFVNLWFYLPIIAEIPIMAAISAYVFSAKARRVPTRVSLRPSTS